MNETERLAKILAEEGAIPEFELTNAAVELRRLSAINAELVEALESCWSEEKYDHDNGSIETAYGFDVEKVEAALEKAKQ